MKGFRGSFAARVVHGAFVVLVLYMVLPAFAFAEHSDEERNFLLMYFKEEELQVVSSTRSIKSISRVAENMTVVTAKDIERMNAHTLADVLNTVNGVEIFFGGATPGNIAQINILGSGPSNRFVTVIIDGVVLNNLAQSVVDVGIIPVQNIEKIEIVKGPASSVWGSALGGVINIITKSPPDSGVVGTASTSFGTKSTGDYRAEARGRAGDAGIYLSVGRLHSGGLRPFTDLTNNYAYAKLTYDFSSNTSLAYTASYQNADRGDFYISDLGVIDSSLSGLDERDRDKAENYFSTLSLNSRLSKELDLNVSVNAQRQRFQQFDFVAGLDLGSHYDDMRLGGSAKLVWKPENNTVVAGFDYDYGMLKSHSIVGGEQRLTKWAFFVNDTISLGKFAITPGARYDGISTNGDFVSPSLGTTYQLTQRTILRADVARGFNMPPLGYTFDSSVGNPNLKPEKVWSYSIGAESGELKYLWVKVSLFRHDVSDAIVAQQVTDSTAMNVNAGRQRRQGVEAEMRTLPVYNTSLSAGATFIDATDLTTHETVKNVSRYLYNIALTYDDKKSFNAMLKGHYVWWNANNDGLVILDSKYSDFIFDFSMNKTIYRNKDQSIEAFLTAHNLFNGNQYIYQIYQNARRWAEVGLRYKF
jgi:vitamin B12 transporter